MDTFKATDEQLHIKELIDKTDKNVMVNAYAGSGKTSTLKYVSKGKDKALYMAFNKAVVTAAELERKEVWQTGEGTCFPDNVDIRTFNGVGYRIWMTAVPHKCFVDLDKMKNIIFAAIRELKGGDRTEASSSYWEIVDAVEKAKALGYVPGVLANGKALITQEEFVKKLAAKPTPFLLDLIDDILEVSIKTAYEGRLDFNDQIYMPALFGGTFPRYHDVYVDEAQDQNPVNHALLYKLARERLCAVGDRWQSIYAFRGAITDGMDRLQEKFGMVEADLTVSFRCPRAVVEAARWRAPGLRWVKDGGKVEVLRSLSPRDFVDESAIICRNNAPLFRIALSLLSEGRSVRVAGTDIGPRITRILEKLGDGDESSNRILAKIDEWKYNKLKTSNTPKTIEDLAECMRVFVGREAKLCHAIARLKDLFAKDRVGTLHLTTGHKAKGAEWNVVYHLDPDLIGSEDQELNLRYVITTRAADTLFMIHTRDLDWMRKENE